MSHARAVSNTYEWTYTSLCYHLCSKLWMEVDSGLSKKIERVCAVTFLLFSACRIFNNFILFYGQHGHLYFPFPLKVMSKEWPLSTNHIIYSDIMVFSLVALQPPPKCYITTSVKGSMGIKVICAKWIWLGGFQGCKVLYIPLQVYQSAWRTETAWGADTLNNVFEMAQKSTRRLWSTFYLLQSSGMECAA